MFLASACSDEVSNPNARLDPVQPLGMRIQTNAPLIPQIGATDQLLIGLSVV